MIKNLKEEREKFLADIEDIVWDRDVSYMEAVQLYQSEKDVEIEIVVKLMTPEFKQKIAEEATKLNLLKIQPDNETD